ncbi:hypothetical protein COO91_00974 [Nostoc flagelliforme CCNUN1]|uniref:Uncharacterized protein n=1 Tax=Nostoc flagelliforme CCNUN1 TaxID=2038116 RepID=A0A2K8SI64_9NOSO|nr:hypothetical protein COO91_00974 [Nostoc flagelliforme CCNUN1]
MGLVNSSLVLECLILLAEHFYFSGKKKIVTILALQLRFYT